VDTAQPDPDAAIGFYRELFGWEFVGPGPMPGEPPGRYFVARLRGRDVAGVSSLPPNGEKSVPVWNTYVCVDSADQAAAKASDAGGAVVVAPFDAPPAGRMAVLRDPAGSVFCAWEPRERQGAQLVNEPGAWAMSQLLTPDPERAKEFYGTMFGWQADGFQFGQVEGALCRVAGYVGGEPQQPVPRDVVAVIVPSGGEVPPQWSVDFWVADADGVAATAAALGGKVIVAPHDVPGFRNTVLADPQGATFSVSQLVIGQPRK
jgi:predicted enzyme related to lactoylglutathione lyase